MSNRIKFYITGWIKKLDFVSGIKNGKEWGFQPFLLRESYYSTNHGGFYPRHKLAILHFQIFNKQLIDDFNKLWPPADEVEKIIKRNIVEDKRTHDETKEKKERLNAEFVKIRNKINKELDKYQNSTLSKENYKRFRDVQDLLRKETDLWHSIKDGEEILEKIKDPKESSGHPYNPDKEELYGHYKIEFNIAQKKSKENPKSDTDFYTNLIATGIESLEKDYADGADEFGDQQYFDYHAYNEE